MKLLSMILIAICVSQVVSAKEVFETNLKLNCSNSKKKFIEKIATNPADEEISIEIRKAVFNYDASKPFTIGSTSNIKIKSAGNSFDAVLLKSMKDRVAFSFVEDDGKAGSTIFSQVYELNLNSLEIKKTSILLFDQVNNNATTSVSYCRKN